MKVGWKSLASIFATVVISPWNLLVGGLLIQHLSFTGTLLAIVLGYAILGVIFVCYGGLGFEFQQQSSAILAKVFPSKAIAYAVPAVLALGQIGWAGVNFELGGKSLAVLLPVHWFVGIILYAALLMGWAMLNLRTLGITKWFVVGASVGLMAWVGLQKLHASSFGAFLAHQPTTANTLFWGLSVVVASLISFATVSPDFFKDVRQRSDIVLSTVAGIIIPGGLTALLGAFLFFDRSNFDLIALISAGSFFYFPHVFNIITNTDGTVATLIASLKLQSLFGVRKSIGAVAAGSVSLGLALVGISSHLELWLKFLSILFPIFIGICFPALVFHQSSKKRSYRTNLAITFIGSLALSVALFAFFPPVVIALVAPLTIFSVVMSYRSLPTNLMLA
jgi:cytosine permease